MRSCGLPFERPRLCADEINHAQGDENHCCCVFHHLGTVLFLNAT